MEEKNFSIEVISAVDLAKRYLSMSPEANTVDQLRQEAASRQFVSDSQRQAAQQMREKMDKWLQDNPMFLYGEKDGKPFIYDMTDSEYEKYLALSEEHKEKYIQKLFTSKEMTAESANESKEAVVAAKSDFIKDGAGVDTEKKRQTQAGFNGQRFGLLELLKIFLQAFGFIPLEQEKKADTKNDVEETQQKQQNPRESAIVDRSNVAQAKALSITNAEVLFAEQQQGQEINKGMHI